MHPSTLSLLPIFLLLRFVSCHQSIWHSSMFGYNVTPSTFSYDNRPVVPLVDRLFADWWFHGHLGYPPHPEDVFELPAGQTIIHEIACDKGVTSFWPTSPNGNAIDPNNPDSPCPNSTTAQYHTTGLSDVKGCALAIAYKDRVNDVQPQDFVVFSVNQTCVWTRFTGFSVPDKMPPCPNNMCICAFFWIHSPDSGSEQMYMNGFQCRVTNSTSDVAVGTPKVARRCGADPENGKPDPVPGNCTYGPKQPLYWYQKEKNTLFEASSAPPFYNDLYNFKDGQQFDIFDNYYESVPEPGPNQTKLPVVNNSSSSSSTSPASNGNTTASTASTPASSVNMVSPSVAPSSSPGASDGSTTPTLSASTASVNSVSPSAAPSSSPTSQCSSPSKRSDSAFSKRGIKSFTHKKLGRHH